MKNTNRPFTLTTLAGALLAIYAADAAAADEEEALNLLTVPSSSVSFGAGYWSGEREQFGIYDNLRGDDGFLILDADIRKRDDATGTWMTGRFRDLGIDTRNMDLRYERQGNWGVGLDYYQMPRVAPYTVNTGMTGLGTEMQSVPTNDITEPDYYEPGTGNDVTLKTERKGAGLNFYKYLAPNLNFKATFKSEDKEGDRHWGRGGAPEFAAEPIDSTIRQLETVLDYAGKQFQMTAGYYGTWYDNHNELVTTDGSSTYYLSLPLDNEAHQFFVNGGYNFTPTMRGTFRVAYTHATQDESLPTADVPDLALPTAPTSLDGEINTTLVNLGLSARPTDKLSLVANLRYHKVDEETPAALIVETVSTRASSRGNITQVHSTPLDYETISGKLEGTYRLPDDYSLIGGVEYKTQDRTVPYGSDFGTVTPPALPDGLDDERYVPFRDELNETTYRLQLRKSLSETLNGSVSYLHSERDGSDYSDAVHSEGLTMDSLISPVNIADRDRDRWRLTVDWVPANNLGLQFNYEESRDTYDGPAAVDYGLSDGTTRLVSLDADYVINENWRLIAWASWDRTKATQKNFHDTNIDDLVDTDRKSRLEDTGESIGLGIDGRISAKLKIGADAEWTRTKSEYENVIDSGYYLDNISPLEDIESTATKLSLFAEYALEKNSDLRVEVIYERWKTDDWTWQFSDGTNFTYGTSWDGTTVVQDTSQSATFVGVSYRHRF